MATPKEHIYAIQNVINKGAMSDDERFSNRLVSHYLYISRGLLLKRKLDKNHTVSETNYQTFCMPLELTNYYDCSCIPSDLKCKILRSTKKIPKEIVKHFGTTLQIKTLDGRTIDKGSIKELTYSEYSLSNDGTIKWFIEDSYLFIYNTTKLTTVVVKGIFDQPEVLKSYTSCTGGNSDPCYDPSTSDFPIDSELVPEMYKMTLDFLLLGNQQREDKTNDSNDV